MGSMSLWYTLGIALALAMDAFAVSVAAGVQAPTLGFEKTARLALSFGFFQFLMTVLGWLAGRSLSRWLEAADHWVAFGLLVFIGGRMIWESYRRGEESPRDPTRGWTLFVLSIATSIDALAVGLSFALLERVHLDAEPDHRGGGAGLERIGRRLRLSLGETLRCVGGAVRRPGAHRHRRQDHGRSPGLAPSTASIRAAAARAAPSSGTNSMASGDPAPMPNSAARRNLGHLEDGLLHQALGSVGPQ